MLTQRLLSLLLVEEILGHLPVAAHNKLSLLAPRDDLASIGLYHLRNEIGEQPACGRCAFLERIRFVHHRRKRAELSHAPASIQTWQRKGGGNAFEQLWWHCRSGDDAEFDRRAICFAKRGMCHLRKEHGRDAVYCRALVSFDALKSLLRVEDFVRQDKGGPSDCARADADNHAERVEEWDGETDHVFGRHTRLLPDVPTTVHDVVVRKCYRLRKPSAA